MCCLLNCRLKYCLMEILSRASVIFKQNWNEQFDDSNDIRGHNPGPPSQRLKYNTIQLSTAFLHQFWKFLCSSCCKMLWTKKQKNINQKLCQFEPTLKCHLFWDLSTFVSIPCSRSTRMKNRPNWMVQSPKNDYVISLRNLQNVCKDKNKQFNFS